MEVTNLAKGQCKIYRPEYIFRKNHVIKLTKSLTNFKSIPNVCFEFISCPETCKQYVLTAIWLLTICTGADVSNLKCKTSTENWIRTAKFSQKVPICSEDMHKIEFNF